MKETIVTVRFPPASAKKSTKVWQSAAFTATYNTKKWKPIVADGIFIISSRVGSFTVNNSSFASSMMCDLKTWKKYSVEFNNIVKAIDPNARIIETEQTITV